MDALSAFSLGALGASAPEILRLYSLRTNPETFRWSWFYLLVSLLFAGLGGLIAVILPTTTYYGAFYAGITTPVIINAAIKKARPSSDTKKSASVPQRRVSFWAFIDGF